MLGTAAGLFAGQYFVLPADKVAQYISVAEGNPANLFGTQDAAQILILFHTLEGNIFNLDFFIRHSVGSSNLSRLSFWRWSRGAVRRGARCAALVGAAAQHDHVVGHHFRAVVLFAFLIFPGAGLQVALDI